MPSLGLAMIVKNGAATLRECIQSVAGVTNQIVIADTGSSDGTPRLARNLGAEVFDFRWQDDFAQARNAAVRALSTDWVLVMDDDEELDAQARHRIPDLLNNTKVGGYYVTVRNYMTTRFGVGGNAPAFRPIISSMRRAERARAYADFPICRLFRRHREIYYAGRVHEVVDPRVRALGLQLRPANFMVHHFGILTSVEERRAKDEFYRKLGWLKVKDMPDDAQAWVEIGLQEYEQFKNYSVAIECFQKALALDASFSTVPFIALANLYVEIQADARALELLWGRTMTGRAAGEREQICGNALYNLGRLRDARSSYLRALRILPEDVRIVSKLGLTEVRLGMKKSGFARLIRALNAAPDILEMHDRLIKAYLLMNMMPQAAEAAERLARECPNPVTILRAVSIVAHMKEWNTAEEIIVRGLQLFPENGELLRAQAELKQEQLGSHKAQVTPQILFSTNSAHPSQAQNSAQCTTGLSEGTGLSRP